MEVRGCILDLDGTLVDTLDDIVAVANEVGSQHRLRRFSREEIRAMIGWGMHGLASRMVAAVARAQDGAPQSDADGADMATRRNWSESEIAALAAELTARYGENPVRFARPYPGVLDTVGSLRRRGIPLAILSNKPHELTLQVVQATLPAADFTTVQGGRDDRPRKPDPTTALEIAALFGVEPGGVAFVGDSEVDVETARAAGMLPVAATWGYRGKSIASADGVWKAIDSPSEIRTILTGDDAGSHR